MKKVLDVHRNSWQLQLALQTAIWIGIRWGKENDMMYLANRYYFGIHLPFMQVVIGYRKDSL